MFEHLIMMITYLMLIEYSFVYMKHIQIIFEVNEKRKYWIFLQGVYLSYIVVNQAPFEIEASGWGEFETQIIVFFSDPNEKPVFVFI